MQLIIKCNAPNNSDAGRPAWFPVRASGKNLYSRCSSALLKASAASVQIAPESR